MKTIADQQAEFAELQELCNAINLHPGRADSHSMLVVPAICDCCGDSFPTRKARKRRGDRQFCFKTECRRIALQQQRSSYKENRQRILQ